MLNNDLIELANSHVTQLINGRDKTDWMVRPNGSEETLHRFPSHFTEQEVFDIMDFVKEYELKALNAGIQFQKKQQDSYSNNLINQQKHLIEELGKDNERLALSLDKAMRDYHILLEENEAN